MYSFFCASINGIFNICGAPTPWAMDKLEFISKLNQTNKDCVPVDSLSDAILLTAHLLRYVSCDMMLSYLDMTPASLRQHFTRLCASKKLKSTPLPCSSGYTNTVYSLTAAGSRYLLNMGYIEEKHNVSKGSTTTLHDFLCSDALFSILMSSADGLSIDTEKAIMYSSSEGRDRNHTVRPDGIISGSKGVLYVELDTGTEKLGALLNKIYRYQYIDMFTHKFGLTERNNSIFIVFSKPISPSSPVTKADAVIFYDLWRHYSQIVGLNITFSEFLNVIKGLELNSLNETSKKNLKKAFEETMKDEEKRLLKSRKHNSTYYKKKRANATPLPYQAKDADGGADISLLSGMAEQNVTGAHSVGCDNKENTSHVDMPFNPNSSLISKNLMDFITRNSLDDDYDEEV